MKKLIIVMGILIISILNTGCSKNMAAATTADIERGEIDVYKLSFYCVDGVKYLKYSDDEQMGTTVKFNKDGTIDTDCTGLIEDDR